MVQLECPKYRNLCVSLTFKSVPFPHFHPLLLSLQYKELVYNGRLGEKVVNFGNNISLAGGKWSSLNAPVSKIHWWRSLLKCSLLQFSARADCFNNLVLDIIERLANARNAVKSTSSENISYSSKRCWVGRYVVSGSCCGLRLFCSVSFLGSSPRTSLSLTWLEFSSLLPCPQRCSRPPPLSSSWSPSPRPPSWAPPPPPPPVVLLPPPPRGASPSRVSRRPSRRSWPRCRPRLRRCTTSSRSSTRSSRQVSLLKIVSNINNIYI